MNKNGWILELKYKHRRLRQQNPPGIVFYACGFGDHYLFGTIGYTCTLGQAAVWNTRASARRYKNEDEVVRRVLLNRENRPMVINGKG